jgi:pimeloyl-ACP methyl ester carboxylesterase
VTVIGNSIGGWIAAEIALAASPRVSGVILIDAAGVPVSGEQAVDFFTLTMDQVLDLSYYRPDPVRASLAQLPAAAQAAMAGNRAVLETYAGHAMADPGLPGRLPAVRVPVLVVWGEADRMIPVEHGRAYAAAIPGARLLTLAQAGHLPQLETPDQLLAAVRDFMAGTAVRSS